MRSMRWGAAIGAAVVVVAGAGAALATHAVVVPVIPRGTIPNVVGNPSGLFVRTEAGGVENRDQLRNYQDTSSEPINTLGPWSPTILGVVGDPLQNTSVGPVHYDGFHGYGDPTAGGVYNGAGVDGVGEVGVVGAGFTTPPAGCVGAFAEDGTGTAAIALHGDSNVDAWICTYP